MRGSFWQCFLALIVFLFSGFVLGAGFNENRNTLAEQSASPKIRVHIQIIADSSNSLQADVEVPVGTPARDLMERLFKMNYADFARRFVNGIAGFIISPREKKFWRLEIDGKASEVGIAEIKISKPMQIRWVITAIQ
ncbi:MAG: DUF4430 domain-containing protein [candidate division KSB1 bacterium]|nr:DUF4430 domain-containing protein [candidate division KSB1 bacterium]MDZ7364369.1 DUF4430 domain-containing protein [candidate division KSB1 bacterium]MDZ7402741.1 DUF4430 domain-containing protein [candidate division KSB1 bacterium]